MAYSRIPRPGAGPPKGPGRWTVALLCVLSGLSAGAGRAPAEGVNATVAIVQYQVRDDDRVGVDAARVEKFVRTAARNGATLVVAPETCFYRYQPWSQNGVTMAQLAAEYDSLRQRFGALAGELGIGLVLGLREPCDAKKVYNTALFFGPDGQILGRHRKTVPSNAEKAWTGAGAKAEPFQTPFGRVGLLICKDAKSHWAEAYDDANLDLYILIAGDDDGKSFGSFAKTAKCFGILANQVTKKGKGRGNSAYGYPNGKTVFLGPGEKTFYVTLALRSSTAPAAKARTHAGPLPGQIVVHPTNPRWFVRHDPKGHHKRFFMCGPGDPEDFLYRGKRRPDGTRDGDQMKLIRKLAGTGANCIYLQAIRSHGGDGDKTHNPFIDHDPAKGLNPKVLDQWARWFAAMDKAGIVIFLFVYDDSARIWNTGHVVGPPERRFLHALVKRFKHHKHLIWCIAEEYQERLTVKRAAAIAAEIRKADDHKHPIAIHKLSGLKFDEFADDPGIDQFAIQYNVKTPGRLHAGVVRAFRAARGRYNLNLAEVAGHGQGASADIRKKTWAGAMGGAYVMVFQMDIASTRRADLADCGRLVAFFESTDFDDMVPCDELAAGDTEYVLANPGSSYIAYTSRHTGRLALTGTFAGKYDLTWLDCAAGKTVNQAGVALAGKDLNLTPPKGFGKEVVVYLRRAKRARTAPAAKRKGPRTKE